MQIEIPSHDNIVTATLITVVDDWLTAHPQDRVWSTDDLVQRALDQAFPDQVCEPRNGSMVWAGFWVGELPPVGVSVDPVVDHLKQILPGIVERILTEALQSLDKAGLVGSR